MRRLTTELATKPQPITPDLISSLLNTKITINNQGKNARRVTPQELLEAVAAYYDIKPTLLKGAKRDRPIARPRQVYMYLSKIELGMTYDDIGGTLSGRDHTTVMHGVETITQELSTNESLRAALTGIKQKLWAPST